MNEVINEKLNDELDAFDWFARRNDVDFSELLGKTIVSIEGAEVENDIIKFVCSDGSVYFMYHERECCESVDIEDIAGDIQDLIGSPITLAEETSNSDDGEQPDDWDDSWTWTYYKLGTVKGYVTIRWYGTSNGYYSEDVDFVRVVDAGGETNE